ncbi:sigma-54 dependent transcriptional regulator [Desulforhabdus sp. TSK]|uniref:sigma-54-dependent transcriptional regulator n=1 Tax=Desulforhabdus sp. TSK TaxID=2925014 RepID=UPI001FC81927|nr:sigma-54 dependent transcriptional regulator [Desulforhabdus sp. TSK]GKT07681.1 sigma-54-dependent Fis family transcriptional regulator [Desulforhabdus sp. TSK]
MTIPMRIAIVDDEITVCRRLSHALAKEGYLVEAFTSGQAFLDVMSRSPFDVVFTDLRLPDFDGMEILSRTKALRADTEVIVITGFGSIDSAIQAIKEGAYYYTTKPLRLNEIRALAKGAIEKLMLREENVRLREALKGEDQLSAIVGNSPPIQSLFSMIQKVAPVDCNVLLQGASGTGKALVARAIHQLSPRKSRPFVSFNCGGFTEELISSELFGYEKGSFTGATVSKVGLLESGSGGTVFLDEVGEMPFSMQVKLLHVLQEKCILRVGGIRPIDLDLRIIAATNRDLKHEVASGNFREDLFFRLNVVTIQLPQLNERKEDIPLLVKHFIKKYSLAFHKPVVDIQSQALQLLINYSYPGNVRELENIIERAVALTDSDHIRVPDLPEDLQQLELDIIQGEGLLSLEEIERRHIARVLEKTGYNKSLTAQILNIPRTTLWRKMKEYKLQ